MGFFPHVRHLRRRQFSRARHQRHLDAFLDVEVTALGSTAASTTVTPLHTSAAAATGTLTFGANAANTKVVTIGDITYTFKTALTEAKASDVFTVGGGGSVIANGNTITLGSKVYTWQTVLTNVDGNVAIGANDTAALLNMLRAITLGTGSGSSYAAATTAHPTVTATASNATTLTVQALLVGTAGNSIVALESSSGSWASATLLGGVAAIPYEVKVSGVNASGSLDALIAAINGDSGAGTTYATGTTAHALVTAAAGAGDTMDVTAVSTGNDGNYIYTTTDVSTSSWGDTSLSGGAAEIFGPTFTAAAHGRLTGDGPVSIFSSNGAAHAPAGFTQGQSYWVIKVDANTLSLAISAEEAGRGNAVPFTGVGTGTISVKKLATDEGFFDFLRRNSAEAIFAATDVDSLS